MECGADMSLHVTGLKYMAARVGVGRTVVVGSCPIVFDNVPWV